MSPKTPRVRFAPSPTGHLHIGGARTALYNWLLARGAGGKFVLRIEDTDQSRSTDENIAEIVDSMRWLGLNWDEGPEAGGEYGPYRQTERSEIYLRHLKTLTDSGFTYPCYCTAEELEEERKQAMAAGKPPLYSRRCRALPPEERAAREEEGRGAAIRFASPDSGVAVVRDLIRGRVEFRNELIGDFIIVRKEGIPTFNFANVIDDLTMEITHIIRGDDHLPNTPRQILIYQALGKEPPQFGHLPMIVGADKKPLSKRHGSTSVEEFRKQGFLPEALLNYLALLGWSLDASTTLFSVPELCEKFSLDRVGKTPATFDMEKLTWMNGVHIRGLNDEDLARHLRPLATESGLISSTPSPDEIAKLTAAASVTKEKMKLLPDFIRLADYLLSGKPSFEEAALEKLRADESTVDFLEAGIGALRELQPFDRETTEAALRELSARLEVKGGRIFLILRVALSGKTVTAGLFESLEVLGEEESLRRLEHAKSLVP